MFAVMATYTSVILTRAGDLCIASYNLLASLIGK